MKTKRLTLLLVFALSSLAVFAGGQKRKVLIIGIDGVRSDALQQANTPNIDALIADGLFTYDAWHCGITVSGPSWSTVMTGVWWNKHGVFNNNYTGSKFNNYPYFTTRAKELLPNLRCVEVIEWPPLIDDVYNDNWDLQLRTPDHDGAATGQVASHQIASDTSVDIMFVYFDQVDGAGHSTGFDPNNPSYMQAIEDADVRIGLIIDSLKSRPTYDEENWLVLITTDHGGIGTGHGGNSDEERHIWWVASGKDVVHQQITAADPGTYNTLVIGLYDESGVNDSILKLSPVQADIAVTALHHIIYETGVHPEQRSDWDLDGKSWLSVFTDTTTGTGTVPVESESISIYPNPTTGLVTLWFENPMHQTVSVNVFDLSGKLVQSKVASQSLNKVNVDLSERPAGTYVVQLKIGAQLLTRKVEIKR